MKGKLSESPCVLSEKSSEKSVVERKLAVYFQYARPFTWQLMEENFMAPSLKFFDSCFVEFSNAVMVNDMF